MANATATQINGYCLITIPSNSHSITLIPKTSGAANWVNYCTWTDAAQPMVPLGGWSAQFSDVTIVSNIFNLINATTKHGTVTANTVPSITAMSSLMLSFSHRLNENAPMEGDDLNITVTNVSDTVTVISIFAEDTGDQNYLDFHMTVVVVS